MGLRFGDCEVLPERFELRRHGEPVSIEPKVLQLLIFLLHHRTRIVTRDELMRAVWPGVKVGEASLTRAVVEARRAIGDDAQQMIVTVRSRGFRFEAAVGEAQGAVASRKQASSPLVGREAPLAAMSAQLDASVAGRASFTWITGVAGIGKTRLLDEVLARARDRGLDVHVAQCHEAPVQPRFRPWIVLLDDIARGSDADAATVKAALLALASASSDHLGVFDGATRALVALARSRPRLLALDDLHWSDEGTLELLRFVAREAREVPLHVVCTFRETAHLDDARSRATGNLLCEYGGVHLPLRGLSHDETAHLIVALKGIEPPPELARAVHERTGGCPLFIQQLLGTEWAERALRDQAQSIATSVDMNRSLVESASRHLEGVSAATRDVLAWAALLGKSFAFAVLERATAMSSGVLLDRLEEAQRGRLVRRGAVGDYRFVHPLVADVLYEGLSPSERAARHRTVALALEAHFGAARDLHAAQIARHFVRAAPTGSAREAFDYCSRAARQAIAIDDLHGALKHWTAALHTLDLVPASEAARLGLLIDLARTAVQARDFDLAHRTLSDARMLAQALGQADALAEVVLDFALPY